MAARTERVRQRPSDPTTHSLDILTRLRSGWRPSQHELEDAPAIERWRVAVAEPYLLQGFIGDHLHIGILFAFDPAAGWARLIDRWVRLGAPALPARPLPANDAVMRCATLAVSCDGRPDIGAAARSLAAWARSNGFDMAGYLLDMAALEADAARSPDHVEHIGDRAAALHQRCRDRKAKRARYRVF
jgi:hypothetical protein